MADNETNPAELKGLVIITGLGFLILVTPKVFRLIKSAIANPMDHKVLYAGTVITLWVSIASFMLKLHRKRTRKLSEGTVLAPNETSVYCGKTDTGEEVHIKTAQRSMHTQVIGTTNAGKTESVILPWAIQDIEQGRGLILIDGKSDRSLLDKLWAYTNRSGRSADFRLFSLSNLPVSSSFNPLIGGTPEEITERVFNAFEFENPYYRALQYEVMGQAMRILHVTKTTPTFQRLHQMISQPKFLMELAQASGVTVLIDWAREFQALPNAERMTRTSGLLSALSHFAFGDTAPLFNSGNGAISLDEALKKNQIIYFQLPVLLSPFMGKATGKMVLQSLQAAIANRHRGDRGEQGTKPRFYSVFLDDFAEYLYPGFVSILNKSRSANIGIVFAHQALGDIETLGAPIANAILTNSNMKVFMRGNDPDSAEYFSKVIGTKATTKYTERQKKGFFGMEKSGDVSARDVEEFMIHPNAFKRDLGVGQAVMLIPHSKGVRTVQIKFDIFPDLPSLPLLEIAKTSEEPLTIATPTADETEPKVKTPNRGKSSRRKEVA